MSSRFIIMVHTFFVLFACLGGPENTKGKRVLLRNLVCGSFRNRSKDMYRHKLFMVPLRKRSQKSMKVLSQNPRTLNPQP